MIRVLFFAQFKERLGTGEYHLEGENIESVMDVIQRLSANIPNWQQEIDPEMCLCAVNQTLVSKDHQVKDGDEVAFFPPVTGG